MPVFLLFDDFFGPAAGIACFWFPLIPLSSILVVRQRVVVSLFLAGQPGSTMAAVT